MSEPADLPPQESFPPKPQIVESRQGGVTRMLVSLAIYAVLFYALFDLSIVSIAAILVVLLIHELGHFALMRAFRYSNVKIFIAPMIGAFTSGHKKTVSQWQLVLIILAGPVPGIIAGALLYWFNKDTDNRNIMILAQTFLAINLFNCLPFHPLDGGRLIETLFFRDHFVIRLVFGIISVVVLSAIAIMLMSPFLLVIPFFVGLELYNENKLNKIREYLRQEQIRYRCDYDDLPDRSYWLIRDCVIFSFPKRYSMVAAGQYEPSVVEPLVVQQVNKVLQIPLIADMHIVSKVLTLIFYVAIIIGPLFLLVLSR